MTKQLEKRKRELAAMSVEELRALQVQHGLRDYKGQADSINYPISKRSLRELMTLDIIRKELFPSH